jgi:hypothetical protein
MAEKAKTEENKNEHPNEYLTSSFAKVASRSNLAEKPCRSIRSLHIPELLYATHPSGTLPKR